MPIDATNGLSGLAPSVLPFDRLGPTSARRSPLGFSSNDTMRPPRSNQKIPIDEASSGVTGWAAIVMSAL